MMNFNFLLTATKYKALCMPTFREFYIYLICLYRNMALSRKRCRHQRRECASRFKAIRTKSGQSEKNAPGSEKITVRQEFYCHTGRTPPQIKVYSLRETAFFFSSAYNRDWDSPEIRQASGIFSPVTPINSCRYSFSACA